MASGSIDVYVKLSMGRNVQYDVSYGTTILKLIGMVAKDECVDQNQVRLKFQGKTLVNTKTVGEYGVRPETILKSETLVPKTLAMVLHLPGDEVEEITMSNLDSIQNLFDIVSEKREKSGVKKGVIDIVCKGQKIKRSTLSLLDTGIQNGSEITVTYQDEVKVSKNSTANLPNPQMDEEQKEAVLSSFQTDGRQVELVFSFDTTGSMFSYLDEVRRNLRDCCTRLIRDIPNIRIGLIAHGDYCDQNVYVLRSVDLTNNVDALVKFANDVPSTSGGDCPECYEWVLRKAQHLDWSENSAKALVVIADLYPHPPSYTDQNIRWRDELGVLKGMGIKVYGVQAGNNNDATKFYEEISEMTEGRHLRLCHFDIITDMFLAVCYREGNEELFEEYQMEVQGAGRMTSEAKAMFDELKETDDEKKEKKEKASSSANPERYVSSAWWDHILDTATTPSYIYDAQTDKWSEQTDRWSEFLCPPSPPIRVVATSERVTKRRKRCSIM